MALKQHGRQYDVVVFGATGYTGKFTAQHIATHLPTDLKWALAGRSGEKLEEVVAQCREWNPDRRPPAVEICSLSDDDLASLARKTFVLITTVGPYARHGEAAFKACATEGTHYLDVTGEVPFVARMIARYSDAAAASGALMFPQLGIESAPSDLVTYSLASLLRTSFSGAKTRDVVVSLRIKGAPSGGTISTALSLLETIPAREAVAAYRPFALSPVPNPHPASPASRSILSRLTGIFRHPFLGLQTTSIADRTDGALVERTWGLLASTPSRNGQTYGPNFSFKQFMHAPSVLGGMAVHFGWMLFYVIMVTPFLRKWLASRATPPGEGSPPEVAKNDEVEYRGVATPDIDSSSGSNAGQGKQAYCRAWFKGPNYYLTGMLLAEAAVTLLQSNITDDLAGGIYTPSFLGQEFIDRLDRAGFHFETKIIDS